MRRNVSLVHILVVDAEGTEQGVMGSKEGPKLSETMNDVVLVLVSDVKGTEEEVGSKEYVKK